MKVLSALIWREYLEHRGAFLFAPALVLLVLTAAISLALVLHGDRIPFAIEFTMPWAPKYFQVAFGAMGVLWSMYAMVALFFYYADSFSADRRNNALYFWKSMPVSDFTILSSKMLAGLTLLPALVFAAMMLSGLVLYVTAGIAAIFLPQLPSLNVLELASTALQVAGLALVYLAFALLWYAPFFAWVGALSAVFGRWSIPLAFLIPGLIGLTEKLFVTGGPRMGYFLTWLGERFDFGHDEQEYARALASAGRTLDTGLLLSLFLGGIDWGQLSGGLIFMAIAVYAASEYRRRRLAA